jgi:DNA-directed RNA polymerase subunit delta
MTEKKRIVKDYDAVPSDIISRVKMAYPDGFEDNLVSYYNKEGVKISALPFETEDIYYLIRMTISEARQIIEEDEDYDEDGHLRDDFESDYFGEDEEDSPAPEEDDQGDSEEDDDGE